MFYKKDFKFALNDSGNESVFLFDPSGKLVSSMDYSGSKTGHSYSWDGKKWRRTPYQTPGFQNIFEELLEGVVKKDDKVYTNVYVYFEAMAGKNAKKFTWDFGDGHKSYKKETRHKYKKKGKYSASLKISGDGEDNTISFEVKVEKYPRVKMRIVAINANPEGKDSELETVTIKNKSKKKVSLKGWSIASGKKKLTNHPIKNDITIKPGKEKEISRDDCSFSLGNEKGKIELRYPDGKDAHKVEYRPKGKTIEEGEVYQKITGGWEWEKAKQKNAEGEMLDVEEETDGGIQNEDVSGTDEDINELDLMPQEEIDAAIGKISPNYGQPKIILASFNYSLPKNVGMVLGVSDMKARSVPAEISQRGKFSFQTYLRKINLFLNGLMWEMQ